MRVPRRWVRLLPVALGITLLAGGLGCTLFYGGGRGEHAPVTLTFLGPDAGCASADPDPAVIWRSGVPGKPQRVEWTVAGDGEYRWVLARAPDKDGGDHFPRRQIRCGEDSVRSGLPMNLPAKGHATWAYQIEVYECGPGPRPEPVCVLDPAVIIKDDR